MENDILLTVPLFKREGMKVREYRNDITDFLDNYLIQVWKTHMSQDIMFGTYLLRDEIDNHFYIRFPGATRGAIYFTKLDDDSYRITDIRMYKSAFDTVVGCYKNSKEVLDGLKQFIGKRIVFEDGEN